MAKKRSKKYKGYPTKTKSIKATPWGRNLSKTGVKSYKKLGKVGNKAVNKSRKRKKR